MPRDWKKQTEKKRARRAQTISYKPDITTLFDAFYTDEKIIDSYLNKEIELVALKNEDLEYLINNYNINLKTINKKVNSK